ncbi:MAG: ATP-binding cassette domain-containing protein [Defluviitaleaceae bacterium]|nr:ATP-binding cassette domain-containing protein [Defluviitaleaceae bacterium]
MELRVEKICKSFGTRQVLKDVSFTVTSGEPLGYLGRNGAGKTTSIRIVADIFRADSGQILLDGKPIDRSKVRLGYLPEERGLYPKSKVGDQMIYIAELRGMTRAGAKKSAQDLLEKLDATEYWDRKLETLSKGNQQKIQLAIAVLHDPEIVILDEPFSGLDPVNAGMLRDLVSEQVKQGKLVMFSSHEMSYVEQFCEHVCIINKGTVVLDGRIKEIKRSYPRNVIGILQEGSPQAFIDSMQNSWGGIVTDAKVVGDEAVVTLKSADDKGQLLQMLADKPVDAVRVIEPSLEEIFVETAGDGQ